MEPAIEREAMLSPGSPPLEILLGGGGEKRATISVTPGGRANALPFVLIGRCEGKEPSENRFASYPPARSARFAMRVPAGTTRFTVSMLAETGGAGGPSVMVKVVIHEG